MPKNFLPGGVLIILGWKPRAKNLGTSSVLDKFKLEQNFDIITVSGWPRTYQIQDKNYYKGLD